MEDRQPAGHVAAFCVEQNINLRETNITFLRKTPEKDGTELENLVPFYQEDRFNIIIPDQLKNRNSTIFWQKLPQK